jgi:YidC/Oxa1 family membrane protein insertase
LRASCWQQTRSISLFGWGSSKSADPDFPKVDSTQPAGNSQSPVYEKWDAGIVSSNPTPIKAVNSTSDTPASALPHTPEPEVLREIENAIAAPHPSLGTEPLLSAEEELSAIPERIGYLKEVCGLDYGWGPTALLEFVVEHLHISGGFTWGASIVASAVMIRLLVFRPSCQSSNISVRMKQANPVLLPLRAEYKEAALAKDNVKQAQLTGQMRMIMQEYNITYGKLLLPVLIQVPLSFGGFRLFRGMAALPVPAFETEKWLWTSDLTQSDPLYILPIISAASLYMSMRVSSSPLVVRGIRCPKTDFWCA